MKNKNINIKSKIKKYLKINNELKYKYNQIKQNIKITYVHENPMLLIIDF